MALQEKVWRTNAILVSRTFSKLGPIHALNRNQSRHPGVLGTLDFANRQV